MSTHELPGVQRLNGGRPIIERVAGHPWENKVTFNPACAFVSDRGELDRIIRKLPFEAEVKARLGREAGLCFLFYRAQGESTPSYDHRRSSIGLAVLSPNLMLLARHDAPVLLPDCEYDNLGVEDARVTRVGDRYMMMYTAYAAGIPDNRIRIALASTTDFVHWEKHGLLRGDFNEIDNKNAMLFEGGGRLRLLHRPMQGTDALSIHLAEADNIFGEWKSRGSIMKPVLHDGFADAWIGGGAPPLKLSDGRYLILYHMGNRKSDRSREYDLGIAIADPSDPAFITKRDDFLMRPSTPAETTGDAELGVNNVVFICGAYFHGGDLYFPYAGADSVVLGGRILQKEIVRYCQKNATN